MSKSADEKAEVSALADELFGAVQTAQGFAFVSDGETFKTKAEFFERVRGRLDWNREATQQMVKFLRKYGQYQTMK